MKVRLGTVEVDEDDVRAIRRFYGAADGPASREMIRTFIVDGGMSRLADEREIMDADEQGRRERREELSEEVADTMSKIEALDGSFAQSQPPRAEKRKRASKK